MKKKTVIIGGAVILILLVGIFVVEERKDSIEWEQSESGEPGHPCDDKTLTDFMVEVIPFFEHPDAYRMIDQKGNDISQAYYKDCNDPYKGGSFSYLWQEAQTMSFASVEPVPGKKIQDDTVVLPLIRTFTCKNDSMYPKIAVRVQLTGCCRYHPGTGVIDSVSQFSRANLLNVRKGQQLQVYLNQEAWGYQTKDEGKTAEVMNTFRLYCIPKQGGKIEKAVDAGKFEISVCADPTGKIWTEPKDGTVYPSKKNTD